ncbi:hypothetical protein EU803_11485 [Loktanella sp. IMCC34160]|uniref:hypothetical protein n=1 Tax=Loktanella sp. IMCC34160 TaxID=2510646 RepID=UPI00101DF2DC|nr:hypothetical protein [Loktanella sp. IMCC34160]RYG90619.1 hypothetical protein EU803_11485 [Loktanella sp. IMCC34160]
MPHAELKYSADLNIDAPAVLRGIEQLILRHDGGAGACKGRAYPAAAFHHTHCLLTLSMLTKPHRDHAFTQALLADLRAELGRHLNQRCALSVGIQYSDDAYWTGEHIPDA